MSRLTGSQLQRVIACPASAALPGSFGEVGYSARRGSAVHKYIYTARKRGREVALFECPVELRDFCAAIDLDALKHYLTQFAIGEAAYRYNALDNETVYLGEDIERNYPRPTVGDFFYSCDFFDEQDDEVVALDVKTGRHPVPPPSENWQMRLGGVGGSRLACIDRARLVVAYLSDEAEWRFVEYDANCIDLDAWAEELRVSVDRVEAARAAVLAGRTPDVSPTDEGCRYCPCVKSCPSTTGLVRQLPGTIETLSQSMREMSVEQLGAGWPVYQRMKQLVEAIGEEYAAILRQEPLPLPNGKRLVMAEQTREYIKGEVALPVLVEHFGADVAQRATKASITKESLKAAVGRDQFERALMLVRDAGGVDVKASFTPREEKAKR